MAHPLYKKCSGWVNRPVTATHVNGQRYQGILRNVTPTGIQIAQSGVRPVVGHQPAIDAITADRAEGSEQAEEIFFPLLFLPFIALTGLALGYAAGGYGYGYGRRYPYYW